MRKSTKCKIYIAIFIILMILFNIYLYYHRIKYEYWDTRDLIFFIVLSNGSIMGLILYFSAIIYIILPSKENVIKKEYMIMSKNQDNKSKLDNVFLSIDRIQAYNDIIYNDLINDLKNITYQDPQDEQDKNKIIDRIQAIITGSNRELDIINQDICDIYNKCNKESVKDKEWYKWKRDLILLY